MRRRVVCGLSETIATLPPQSAFTSVDLPTFGRPATATKPLRTRSTLQRERFGQELARRPRNDLSLRRRVGDPLDPELVQPLPAAAARRRVDRDRLEVVALVALRDRSRERGALGADAERIGGVLDVHALDHVALARQDGGADLEARVRRVRALGDGDGALVELLVGHVKTWKRTSSPSAPRTPPYRTSTAEWT